MHCYTGQVGSVHDQRVFRLSGLQDIWNSANYYPDNSHIVADQAYKIQEHVLVAYRNNGHLNAVQRYYNRCLSRARLVVERAIGVLKGRWRRLLLKLPMIRVDLIPYLIMSACVLHNICVMKGDLYNVRYRRRVLRRVVQDNVVSVASRNRGMDGYLTKLQVQKKMFCQFI